MPFSRPVFRVFSTFIFSQIFSTDNLTSRVQINRLFHLFVFCKRLFFNVYKMLTSLDPCTTGLPTSTNFFFLLIQHTNYLHEVRIMVVQSLWIQSIQSNCNRKIFAPLRFRTHNLSFIIIVFHSYTTSIHFIIGKYICPLLPEFST